MAQYFTDFSEYAADAAPSDWTTRWVTSNVTWSVVADGGATGGKILRATRTTGGRSLLSWDEIDGDAGRATVEVLCRMRIANTTTTAGSFRCASLVRGSGAATSETGYGGRLDGEERGIQRYLNGAATLIANVVAAQSANTWYWVRFQANGSALKVRVWTGDIGDEPGTWTAEVTDTFISAAGWVGAFIFFQTTCDWDIFSVGTGGDPAPSEAPASAITGTAAIVESPDTLSAAGTATTPTITGEASIAEVADTLVASGTVTAPTISGSAAIAEAADALAAVGTVTAPTITGTSAITESPDTLAASGTVMAPVISGSAAITESPDTLSAEGTVISTTIGGAAAITEASDTLDASGTVTAPTITGVVEITEGSDTLAVAGTVTAPTISGTVDTTEASDVLNAAGTVTSPTITGTVAITEGPDELAAAGVVLIMHVTGAAAIVEAADTLAGAGTVAGDIVTVCNILNIPWEDRIAPIPWQNRIEEIRCSQ